MSESTVTQTSRAESDTSSSHEPPSEADAIRSFVDAWVRPYADAWHRDEQTPRSVIDRIAQEGYLGATLPEEDGGGGMSMGQYALLMEELGAGCSSLRSLVTVHCMASGVLQRWGSDALVSRWLPRLACGSAIAGYALSEPQAGSDATSIATQAAFADDETSGGAYLVNGEKKWTTYGQIADVFLVFARIDGDLGALWVERDRPGLTVEPMSGMLGTRASMPARLHFDGCRVPADQVVGRPGFGYGALLAGSLTQGRLAVAMGCVGLARACLQACAGYTRHRTQFGRALEEYQLIQRKMTNMDVQVEAARLMGHRAAQLIDDGDPQSSIAAAQAKYFAADVACTAANNAVEMHGGNGCHASHSLQRYLGDAKVMEVIEGTPEILQTTLASSVYRRHATGPDADSRAGAASPTP